MDDKLGKWVDCKWIDWNRIPSLYFHRLMLDFENRIRALEKKDPLTNEEFMKQMYKVFGEIDGR